MLVQNSVSDRRFELRFGRSFATSSVVKAERAANGEREQWAWKIHGLKAPEGLAQAHLAKPPRRSPAPLSLSSRGKCPARDGRLRELKLVRIVMLEDGASKAAWPKESPSTALYSQAVP